MILSSCVLGLTVATDHYRHLAQSPFPLSSTCHPRGALPLGGDLSREALAAVAVPVVALFRRGDTLEKVLTAAGLDRESAWSISQEAARHVDLTALRAGDEYATWIRGAEPVAFSWELPGRGRVRIDRKAAGWAGEFHEFDRRIKTRTVVGRLHGSLDASIRAAGAPGALAYAMSDVLQWDLDFNRDLRAGDEFRVSYEELWLDGRFAKVSSIAALVYENRDRQLEAYRFGEDGGYYSGSGRPLEKQFLRSPLPYSRVTSNFSHRRFHPVLKTYRPHYGVDYGAPVGTPVRVTANGTVTFVGWDRGGGNTIKVRHANGYQTAYLHLSRFDEGLRRGRSVTQGEVVGYVGATGLATGPHLDYRVKKNGRYMNPLDLAKQNLPADPIPEAEKMRFAMHRDELREQIGFVGFNEPDHQADRADLGSSGSAALETTD